MIKETQKEETCFPENETSSPAPLQWNTEKKPRLAEKLSRNTALAGMILITIVAVRTAQLPSGKSVLTAIQEIIEPNLDESLGKISFVTKLFPETVAVFFDAGAQISLTAPCFGNITHPWRADEPYVAFDASSGKVYAAAAGQVMSIAHGMEEERIIRIRHENGVETMYYNLENVWVQEGDEVTADTCLGTVLKDEQAAVEVRRAGRAVESTFSPRAALP